MSLKWFRLSSDHGVGVGGNDWSRIGILCMVSVKIWRVVADNFTPNSRDSNGSVIEYCPCLSEILPS